MYGVDAIEPEIPLVGGLGGGELCDLDRFGRVAHVIDGLCAPPDRMAVIVGWVEIFFVDDQERA